MLKRIPFVLLSLLLATLVGCGNGGGETDCTDADLDGYGVGADCTGADCNDADGTCWNTGDACCTSNNCVDGDGDGYGAGTDCYGPDCNDNDNACWTGACCGGTDCTDLDQDGYGVGVDCLGADCNDNDALCYAGACCTATDCDDNDGDNYGLGADCLGLDCNDADINCWEGDCCPGSCMDLDEDGYGQGTGCDGPDCDDANAACHEGDCCPVYCTDVDQDGYGIGQDCLGPDCNDNDAACHEGGCCPTDLDLSGVWAQRFCQNEHYDTTLGEDAGTRIVLARIEIDHVGNTLTEVSTACDIIIPQMGSIQVTFPPALTNSIPSVTTVRTLATNSIGDAYENNSDPLIQLIGWQPTSGDPENEEIPQDENDSRIYDMDGDGEIGATANIFVDIGTNGINCDIYVVARTVIRVDGTVISPTEISGSASSVSADQVTLDATNFLCQTGATITQQPGSTFKKAKLADENMTCAQIVANMDSVFGGPCPEFIP